MPVCLAVSSLPEASVPLPGLAVGLAQAYQTEQAGPSHLRHRDGPQMPATLVHYYIVVSWCHPLFLSRRRRWRFWGGVWILNCPWFNPGGSGTAVPGFII